ncbi:hypothetical protein [Nostoc sp.]|uniref:hypothetical protein n=1 Tax=Nostoc sp. TaxID=1180 RepID=UPI002FFB6937
MANIKIAELQSSLLEEVSVIDLDAVHGGAPGFQVVGATTGLGVGYTNNGGSSFTNTTTASLFSGSEEAFLFQVGTFTVGRTSRT